jgi:hypothetical protein
MDKVISEKWTKIRTLEGKSVPNIFCHFADCYVPLGQMTFKFLLLNALSLLYNNFIAGRESCERENNKIHAVSMVKCGN